jgi:DNA-binding transcriptional LysR family regulator
MPDIDQIKIRQLDFSLLLIARSLLRHRRTTETARELGLSQSAISHALGRLRTAFGDELFVRRPHGLEPTRHALELGRRIDVILAETQAALGLAEQFDPVVTTREFRIAAPDFLTTVMAGPLLALMQAEAPGARVAHRIALGADALALLERDEIDLAVGRFPPLGEAFRVRDLYRDRYCAVARVGRIEGRLTRAQFERLAHVAVSVSGDFRTLTDDDFRDLGLVRRVVATAPRFTIAFGMVGQTEAVAIAPERLARARAAAYGLETHELPFSLPPLHVVAVVRARAHPGVDWLVDKVREAAG